MDVLASVGRWALILGAIGLVGGYVGPMVVTPEANQGPLLGIFITGPGGALLGALIGLVAGLMRRSRGG